jgi:signal transduction histidine kinase
VIQRLFATGMALESVTRQVGVPAVQAKLHRAVDELDQTIRDIRNTIFALQATDDEPRPLRQQILAVVEEATAGSGLVLDARMSGPVDSVVPAEVGAHALAVLREALANVVRHAKADQVVVSVAAADRLRVEVVDDGVGIPDDGRRSGLANLADRAARLGGGFSAGRAPAGAGAQVVWEVPLDRAAGGPGAARPVPPRGGTGRGCREGQLTVASQSCTTGMSTRW